jgi:malate synthase
MSTPPTLTPSDSYYRPLGNLRVAEVFYQFVENELLPGSGVSSADFWSGLQTLVSEMAPLNRALLQHRDKLQQQIDDWHREQVGQSTDSGLSAKGTLYQAFLEEIGYLQAEPADFLITTNNVDAEIAALAGPQLVVPVMNARYALNAANARWGSLYDALYGTDVIADDEGLTRQPGYDPRRGSKVIAYGRSFLDEFFPLSHGASHAQVRTYRILAGALQVNFEGGEAAGLADPAQFAGFTGNAAAPDSVLLVHHGLHVEICIDANHAIGQQDKAGVRDIVLEAALTTIQDCEDSVAAVDAADKVAVYRNWLGLMRGDLRCVFTKDGVDHTRTLAADREYTGADGGLRALPGRSLMLVRNVGHLMTNDAVLDEHGQEIPEGLLDALVTSAAALHDLRKTSGSRNSRTGSIYIVKPKMHGPAEVAFTCKVFAAVEKILGLSADTLKIGIMDEERRTSLNLKACIFEARSRLIFINTGFLDRTGDEIHTSMHAGAFVRKADIKASRWIRAYENRNVAIGLACGLSGRAQIGKGMWAMPDEMAAMMTEKVAHPMAGASCAWVPSPTAATLHAIHYHRVDVAATQRELAQREMLPIAELLSLSVAQSGSWSAQQIQQELDNNAQGLLGYVVRWIDQGIGCSKVPDISGTGLMEDRATLRISSQHIANWLHHGVCSAEQVMHTLQRMAVIVDKQNAGDPQYRPMSPAFDNSIAFQAACDLVFYALQQPCGYTEPLLHRHRRSHKEVVLS